MRRMIVLFAAASLIGGLAGAAQAQKLDANGRCHDAAGQFAKAEVCAGASKSKSKSASKAPAKADTAPAAAAPPARTSTQKCKNDKGKYAKCGSPGAHPA